MTIVEQSCAWLALRSSSPRSCFGTTGTAQALGPGGLAPAGVGAARILVGGACSSSSRPGARCYRRSRGSRAGLSLIAAGAVATYQLSFFAAVADTGVAVGHDRRARLRARPGRRDRVGGRTARARALVGDGDRARVRRRGDARDGRRRRVDLAPRRPARAGRRRLLRGLHARRQADADRRPRDRDRDGGRVRRSARSCSLPVLAHHRRRLARAARRRGARDLPRHRPDRRRVPGVRARPAPAQRGRDRDADAGRAADRRAARRDRPERADVGARGARRRADPRRACSCSPPPRSAGPLPSRRDRGRDRRRRAAPGDPLRRAPRGRTAGRAGPERALRRRPPLAARGAPRAGRRGARARRDQPRRARRAPRRASRSSSSTSCARRSRSRRRGSRSSATAAASRRACTARSPSSNARARPASGARSTTPTPSCTARSSPPRSARGSRPRTRALDGELRLFLNQLEPLWSTRNGWPPTTPRSCGGWSATGRQCCGRTWRSRRRRWWPRKGTPGGRAVSATRPPGEERGVGTRRETYAERLSSGCPRLEAGNAALSALERDPVRWAQLRSSGTACHP